MRCSRSKKTILTLMCVTLLTAGAPDIRAGGGRERTDEPSVTDETGVDSTTVSPARTPVAADSGITTARPAPDTLDPEYLDQGAPAGADREFATDFSRGTVDFSDILSGGPPKDGIPSIDDPRFVTVEEAKQWIAPQEAVLAMTRGDTTRIYPLQILMWHEIVNDTIGDLPVAVTWCPLCNTAVAFDRRAPGTDDVLEFGVSGRLRFSNLIMYDRTTESWWQQADGEGIAGAYAGARLAMIPVLTLSFEEVQQVYPDAQVLSRETGFRRSYGANPYRGYEDSEEPFLYRGPATDTSFRNLERALVYLDGETSRAVAYSVLREHRVIPVTIDGADGYLLWSPGVAGSLSARTVSDGPDVGTANAFLARTHAGTEVDLYADETGSEPVIRDRETESTWSAAGHALEGSLQGERLVPSATVQHFWFSASAFGAIQLEDPVFQ